jgi:hypothetical protein
MEEPQTLKNGSENKILEIGHLILQSLGGHQTPDSALLAKEELPGSIKVRLLTNLRSSLRTALSNPVAIRHMWRQAI